MTEVIRLIFDLLAIVGGATGVISLFVFRKQDKRIKVAEATVQEASAQTSIVSNYETLLDRYEKTLQDSDSKRQLAENFHQERYEFLEKKMKENEKKLEGFMESEKKMRPLICYDLNCKLRQSLKK